MPNRIVKQIIPSVILTTTGRRLEEGATRALMAARERPVVDGGEGATRALMAMRRRGRGACTNKLFMECEEPKENAV